MQGLNEVIRNELIDLPIATKDTKGLVIIGDNITIDENNRINITADDVKRALNYTPAKASSDNNIASETDKLAKPVSIQGVNFDGSTNINNYVICETSADEQIKKIELTNFIPETGAELIINFINGNTHKQPLLQVNDEQAYPIIYNSNFFVNIQESHTYHFIFNDNKYHLINEANIIFGVKGDANQEYKTGLVNLDKNDIGLDCVDNTADSVKSVLSATYALKDASGNDFDLQYCTNAAKTEINRTIQQNKELENTHYNELKDKHSLTNDIIADLRTDIIYNTNHINANAEQINTIDDKVTIINTQINSNDERINDLYSELTIINNNIHSIFDVAQTGLNNAAQVATDLADTNAKIALNKASITSALAAIDNIDRNAETAIKDQHNNVIDEYYAPINNPLFTGSVRINTNISIDNNNNILATTKFVHDLVNQVLQIDTKVLSAFAQLSDLLSDNTALSDNILSLIESKQDKTDILSNFLITAEKVDNNALMVNCGYNIWDYWPVNSFAAEYLSQPTAHMVRDKLNALGKNEKAVSAVNADTATSCIGNALTANKLYVSRSFSVTDGINTGEQIEFDGSDSISIPLPKKFQANIDGVSKYAELLHNAKNIQVNLASTNKVQFDNDKDIYPGVTGILPIEHGGTGVNNIDDITIGISKRIENYIDLSPSSERNIIYTQFNDEFVRMRIDMEEDNNIDTNNTNIDTNNTNTDTNNTNTNTNNNIDNDTNTENDNNINGTNTHGYLEIATADKANAPIYIRQYYGNFDICERTLTLLDSKGNTNIPGRLTMHELIIPTERPKNPTNGSIWIE